MMDLENFEALLSSLAPLSGAHYQIWDTDPEIIFSTDVLHSKGRHKTQWREFSHHIITDGKGFRYSIRDDGRFMCGIPLLNGHEIFGALLAHGREPDEAHRIDGVNGPGSSRAEEMKNLFLNLKRVVEENLAAKEDMEDLAQELDKSFEDLYLYGQIASKLNALRFSHDMLKTLLSQLPDNMRVDAAFAWMPERLKFNCQVVNPKVFDRISVPESYFKALVGLIPPDAADSDEAYFIVNDSRKSARHQALVEDPYRFLAVKVKYHETFYGWLGLVSFDLDEIFRRGELKLLISLAEQLAGVIANTDLYENLEQFIINMVRSLVFAIEAKDVYTRGHSERVSNYSMLIGARLGLKEKEYNDLKWASILHDIGKIGIPENILNKPGRLTDKEYEIIKEHPRKGGEILKPIKQLADSLRSIVHHHERYDGAGYPGGLKGEAIPLGARIIAVADTYDAINSSRSYRGASSSQKALAIVEEVAGSQLDPKIVEVFKEVCKEKLMVREEAICPKI